MSSDRQIKILLVDDEVKYLKAVGERLSLKGFDVTTAATGDAAIQAAQDGFFDVAVLDVQMPGMDGAALLKTLKERHKFLEIIMLTGHATYDSAVECTKLGAFKYIEKSNDFDAFVETLAEAYQHRLQKKDEHNEKRIKEIQKLSMGRSPLGLLKALATLDDDQK